MEKALALLTALILFICSVFAIDAYYSKVADKCPSAFYYGNSHERNNCVEYMQNNIDSNTALVLGSSELSSRNKVSSPDAIYRNGNSDFNMILCGQGHVQSLQHALDIGAYGNGIENKKVVLILSPQWFEKGGIPPEAFSSMFLPSVFTSFVNNENISKELKLKIIKRMIPLLASNPQQQDYVKEYEVKLQGENSCKSNLKLAARDRFWDFKRKVELSLIHI